MAIYFVKNIVHFLRWLSLQKFVSRTPSQSLGCLSLLFQQPWPSWKWWNGPPLSPSFEESWGQNVFLLSWVHPCPTQWFQHNIPGKYYDFQNTFWECKCMYILLKGSVCKQGQTAQQWHWAVDHADDLSPFLLDNFFQVCIFNNCIH